MKKIISLVIAILLLISLPLGTYAQADISVWLDGQKLQFAVPPTVVDGRTMVPMRAIFESLNASVDWDQNTKTATAIKGSTTVKISIGEKIAYTNGKQMELDAPARLISNTTMVPLRFVSEALGATVGWEGNTRSVIISTAAKQEVPVTRVVDGDTIEIDLNGNIEKVRLIGVDTPETVHPTKGEQPYGREASNFTKEQLTNQTILLELDVSERDRYGRVLGYIYLSDGTFFNAKLAADGYAQVATFPPNVRWVDLFTELEKNAREYDRGLWSAKEVTTEQLKEQPADSSGNFDFTSKPPNPATPYYISPNSDDPKIKGNINSKGEKIYHVPGGAFYDKTIPEALFSSEEEAQQAGFRASSR